MYAELLELALGPDVDVYLPGAAGESSADRAFSGEFTVDPLLPTVWRRHALPASPAAFLQALETEVVGLAHGVVFIVAPWLSVRELPPEVRKVHGSLGFHEIALLTVAERATAGLRIASLVPYTTVAGESARGFRGEFFTRTHPDLVIADERVAGEIGLHASFRAATIVATAGRGADVTRFFRVPRDVSEDDLMTDLGRLLAREGGATSHGYVLRERLPPGSSLSHDLRSPDLAAAKGSLEHLGDLRPITEVFEFVPGVNVALDPDMVAAYDAESDLPLLIEGRAVRRGYISVDEVTRRVAVPGSRLLRVGDVLVRAIAHSTDARLTVAEVEDGLPTACAAASVVVLRPREVTTVEQRRVAVQYLSSSLAMRVVQAMSAGGSQVGGSLRRMLVPVPDADLDVAIRDLREAADQFRRWALEAESASSELFERVSPEEWRAQVLRTGHRVRERERAARQIDELGFRVRTLFPHPLAYAWRIIEASRPDYPGYKTVLETAETLLTYVAILAFVGVRALGEQVPYVVGIAARLDDSPERGVNMGDWYSILDQIQCGRAIRPRTADMPFPEIFEVWRDEGSSGALRRLKSRRDDDSHGRRPDDSELETEYSEARADLAILFGAADFLVDYPLRLIEETRWRALDDSTEYDYRDLRGDHHLVPLDRARVSVHRLEQGSLYVATRRNDLHRISPILVRARCPQCSSTATFCFDKLDRVSRAPIYKALEHRHPAERPDLADDLRSIGLLSATG